MSDTSSGTPATCPTCGGTSQAPNQCHRALPVQPESEFDQIRRTLQTHTPAGKDKRHDGCSCFAEALEALARVEAVIEAADLIAAWQAKGLLGEHISALRKAIDALSPSTPVRDPIDPLCGRPLSEHSPLPGNGIDHDDISCPSTPVKEPT